MKKKSIKFNAVLNVIKQACSLVFPLLTFPYASRILGVENYGKINFINSIIVYFSLLAALGVQTYAVREGARLREEKEKFSQFANQIFSINVITTIVSYIILIVLCFSWDKLSDYSILIFVQSFVIICATVGCEWVNIVFEDYTYITIRYIFLQLISLVCMFVLVKDVDDYIIYAGISTFAQAGAGLINMFYIRKYTKIKLLFKNIYFKKHIKPLIILFGVTVSSYIYINSDITMLGVFQNDVQVGIYSTGTKVYNMIKQLICAIVVVTAPRVSALLGERKTKEYNDLLKNIIEVTLLILVPLTIGLFMEGRQIIMVLSGEEYLESYIVLQILCVALIPACLAYFYSTTILVPNRQEKTFLRATVVSAIVNILLNIFLIPKWGMYGAAVSTVVSEMIVFLITVIFSAKLHEKFGVKKTLVNCVVGGALICFVCFLTNKWVVGDLANLLVSVILSCIVYGGCLIIGKNNAVIEAIHKIKKR